MSGSFNTEYLIAITLQGLESVKALRNEIQLLRDDSRQPIDFNIGFKTNAAQDMGKEVEEQVTKGLQAAMRKGPRGGGGAPAGTMGTVAFDQTSLNNLHSAIDKLVRAVDTQKPKEVELNTAQIQQAVAQGVAEGLSRAPHPTTPVVERPIENRGALEQRLNKAMDVSGNVHKATIADSKKIEELLKERSALLNGALDAQLSQLRKQIDKEAEELRGASNMLDKSLFAHNAANGGEGAAIEATQHLNEEIEELQQKYFEGLKKLMQESRKPVMEVAAELQQTLERGTERVVSQGMSAMGGGDFAFSFERSMERMAKTMGSSLTEIGDALSQQIQAMVDVLARMPAQVQDRGNRALEEVEAAAQELGVAPGRSRRGGRRINAGRVAGRQQNYRDPYQLNNSTFEDASADDIAAARARLEDRDARKLADLEERARKRELRAEATRKAKLEQLVNEYSPEELDAIQREARLNRVFFSSTRQGKPVSGIAITQQQIADMAGPYGAAFGGQAEAAQLKGRDAAEYARRRATSAQLAGLNFGESGVAMTFGQAGNYAGVMGRVLSVFRNVEKAGEPSLQDFQQWNRLKQHPFVRQVLGDVELSRGLAAHSRSTVEGVRNTLVDALRISGQYRAPRAGMPFAGGEFVTPAMLEAMPVTLPAPLEDLMALRERFGKAYSTVHEVRLQSKNTAWGPGEVPVYALEERKAAREELKQVVAAMKKLKDPSKHGQRAVRSIRDLDQYIESGLAQQQAQSRVQQTLQAGADFAYYDKPTLGVLESQIRAYEQVLRGRGVNSKLRETVSQRLDQLTKLHLAGGEYFTGSTFKQFTFAHPEVSPDLRETLQRRMAALVPGYEVPEFRGDTPRVQDALQFPQNRERPLPAGARRNIAVSASFAEDKLRAQLRALPGRRAALNTRVDETLATLQNMLGPASLDEYRAFAQSSVQNREQRRELEGWLADFESGRREYNDPATHGAILDQTPRVTQRNARERVARALAGARARYGTISPNALRTILAGLPTDTPLVEHHVGRLDQWMSSITEIDRHGVELENELAKIEAHKSSRVELGDSDLDSAAHAQVLAQSALRKKALNDAHSASEAAKLGTVVGPESALAAGGAGGTGGAPPPAAVGGLGFPAGGDPEHVRQLKSALTDLGNVQLDRLAGELASIAGSLKMMSKNPLTGKLAEIQARTAGKIEVLAADDMAKQDRIRLAADEQIRKEEARTAEILKRGSVRAALRTNIDAAMDTFSGAVAAGGAPATLSPEALVLQFGRRASRAVRDDMALEDALALSAMGRGNPRKLLNIGSRVDANRAGLFGLLGQASQVIPGRGFGALGTQIGAYSGIVAQRMGSEDVLEQLMMPGPKAPAQLIDNQVQAIGRWRTQEQALAHDIMHRGAAEMAAFKQTESHVSAVERFGSKLRSIAMYAGAGFLLYNMFGHVATEFGNAKSFEVDMAQLQGIAGGNTRVRAQLQGDILGGARRYGASPLEVARAARTLYPSFRGDTAGALNDSLLAQRGLGFDEARASELLLAVHEQTDGAVSGQDMLDRLAKLENTHAVTSQELAVVIQRVGQQALQMQPGRGVQDSYSALLGLATHTMEATRISGEQTATMLRTVMSRLGTPETQKKLQNLGVELGGNSPLELRPVMDILHDVARVYNDLKNKGQTSQAADLLVQLGGPRQAPYLAGLLEDFGKAEQTAVEASLAYGEAQRRLITNLDTLDAQLKSFGATFFQFFNGFLQNSGLMSALKFVVGGSSSLLGRVATGFGTELGADVMPGATMIAGGVGLMGLQRFGKNYGQALSLRGTRTVVGATGAMETEGSLIAENLGAVLTGIGASEVVAGLAAFTAAIGAIAAAAGAFKYLHDLYTDATHATSYVSDVDIAALKGSEQYKGYAQLAGNYGQSVGGLYGATAIAMQRAQGDVAGQSWFVKAGLNPATAFASDEAMRKTDPRLAGALQTAFETRLGELVPGFKDIKDESTRTAAALAILRGSVIQGTAVGATGAAGLEERLDQWINSLGSGLDNALSVSPEGIVQRVAGGHGGASTTRRVFTGFGYTRAGALANHAGIATDAVVGGDIHGILNSALPGGLGAVLPGIALVDETGRGLGNVLKHITDVVQLSGVSLGKALDDMTKQFYEYGPGEEAQVGALKGGSLESRARALVAGGAPHAAQVLRNRTALDNLLVSAIDSYYQDDREAQQAKKKQGELTGTEGASGAGSEFRNFILSELRQVAAQRAHRFVSAAAAGSAQTLLAGVNALMNPDNQARMNLAIQQNNSRGLLRDRILEPLITYGVSMQGLGAEDELYGLGGLRIGGKFTERQASATDEALRALLGVRSSMVGDLARLQNRRSQLMGSSGLQGLQGVEYDEAGMATYRGEDPKIKAALAVINKSVLKTPEGQAMTQDIAHMQEALSAVAQNDSVMKYLTPSVRSQLFSWLGGARAPGTLPKIIDALSGVRGRLEGQLTAESASVFNAGYGGRTAEQFIGSRQALARAGLANAQRLADVRGDIGGSLNLRMRSVYQDAAFEQERIRLSASAREAVLREQAMHDGSYGGDQYRESIRQLGRDTDLQLVASQDRLVQAIVDLRDTMHLEVEQRRQAVVSEMTSGVTSGFAAIFGGGYSRIRQLHARDANGVRQLAPTLLDPVTDTINKRIADNFTDSLFGQHGVFSGFMQKAFGADVFQTQADLIYAAHVSGIVDGFKNVGIVGGAPSGGPTSGDATGELSGGSVTAGAIGFTAASLPILLTPSHPDLPPGYIRIGGITGPAPHAMPIPGSTSSTGTSRWGRVGYLAAQLGGQLGGAMIGTQLGVRGPQGNYADFGSSTGALLGSAFGPVGTLAGGLLGGFIGGRFGRGHAPTPEYEVLSKIEANTRAVPDAIQNQTRQLLSLDARYLNLPSTFNFPRSYSVTGGSGATSAGNHTFNITVPVQVSERVDAQHVANVVSTTIRNELSAAGVYSSIRR